jgi:hypothetical protein
MLATSSGQKSGFAAMDDSDLRAAREAGLLPRGVAPEIRVWPKPLGLAALLEMGRIVAFIRDAGGRWQGSATELPDDIELDDLYEAEDLGLIAIGYIGETADDDDFDDCPELDITLAEPRPAPDGGEPAELQTSLEPDHVPAATPEPDFDGDENNLWQQERQLRLAHRMQKETGRTPLAFKAWVASCGIDLDHLYRFERQELGALAGVTREDYLRFSTDPMGRTRKDAKGVKQPDARFPSAFIPGCFTEDQAEAFRKQSNRTKRAAAERLRRKENATAHATVEKDQGLNAMQKALVRALDCWMTPLDATRALRRSVGWKSMKAQSRKRRINEMVPALVKSGHIEIEPKTPRRIRRRR